MNSVCAAFNGKNEEISGNQTTTEHGSGAGNPDAGLGVIGTRGHQTSTQVDPMTLAMASELIMEKIEGADQFAPLFRVAEMCGLGYAAAVDVGRVLLSSGKIIVACPDPFAGLLIAPASMKEVEPFFGFEGDGVIQVAENDHVAAHVRELESAFTDPRVARRNQNKSFPEAPAATLPGTAGDATDVTTHGVSSRAETSQQSSPAGESSPAGGTVDPRVARRLDGGLRAAIERHIEAGGKLEIMPAPDPVTRDDDIPFGDVKPDVVDPRVSRRLQSAEVQRALAQNS